MNDVIVYYDRSLRLWTAIKVDEQGFQVGNAGYGPTKELAIADIQESCCEQYQ